MRGTGKKDHKGKKNKVSKMRIAKCWSLIRYLVEEPKIFYYQEIELIAKPLLQKIA
jgi:hypothetical protein